MTNLLGLFVAYLYIFAIIGLAELLRRWRGYGSDFTRKVIHIGVGMLSWGIGFLFDSPWPFVFACFSFVIINLLDIRYGFFSAMTSSDRTNLGTVYFPIAAGIVAIIFWDQQPLLVAALMPLTWGDGLAPVVGRRFGTHRYLIRGHMRTVEGSAAFFIAGGFFTWLALWLQVGTPALSPVEALLPAFVVIAAATLTEAFSIWGLDNLTVTAVSTLILGFWPF